MKILVTGADGQVGTEMVRLSDDGFRVAGLTRRDLDITDRDAVAFRLDEQEPDFLVNCAAYTAVDRAEDEPDPAYRVNADAVGWLGEACDTRGVGVIHFSTDYVFDGAKNGPYTEDDAPNPLNVYGASKLEGENRLRAATDRHLILRVSWVFGRIGRSFVDTILRLARERDEIERWRADLQTLDEAIQEREFAAFLGMPKILISQKMSVIQEAMPDLNPLAHNLLGLLAARGVVDTLPSIREEYGGLLDQLRGLERASVVSAVPLEDAQRERLAAYLRELIGREIELTVSVDPDIVAGMVARVGDRLIDGSARTKLRNLRNSLAEAAY